MAIRTRGESSGQKLMQNSEEELSERDMLNQKWEPEKMGTRTVTPMCKNQYSIFGNTVKEELDSMACFQNSQDFLLFEFFFEFVWVDTNFSWLSM